MCDWGRFFTNYESQITNHFPPRALISFAVNAACC